MSKTLPDGWKKVQLSQIAPPSRQTLQPNGSEEYNYVGLENIESNTGKLVNFSVSTGIDIKSTKIAFKKGMVLYGKLRPYLNKVWVADFNGIATTEIIPFKCTDEIIPKYLGFFLRSNTFVDKAKASCSGARMPRITTTFLKEFSEIPLPPLSEQERIVKKLDSLFDRIDKSISLLEENIKHTESIMPSALNEVFEKKIRKEKLENIIKLNYGKALKKNDRKTGNIPVYGSNGIVGYHDIALVNYPTVVIGRKGSVGELNFSENSSWVIDTAYFVEIIDKKQLLLEYFYHIAKALDISNITQKGVKPGINRNDYLNMSIPLPTLPEQKQIVAYFDNLSEKTTATLTEQRAKLANLKALKASILDSAFKGEL